MDKMDLQEHFLKIKKKIIYFRTMKEIQRFGMIINQIINKNNIITDGKLPDSAVLTQKLVNVLYANFLFRSVML